MDNQDKVIFAVIVAYKDRVMLETCIRHLLLQTKPIHTILIIDNSEDRIDTKSLKLSPSIHIIKQIENTGSAGGFALGIDEAFTGGADWIWLHDEDDFPSSDCLEKLLQMDFGKIRAPQIIDPTNGKILTYFKRTKKWGGYYFPADNGKIDVAGTAGLLIHRDIVEKVGTYDHTFFVGFEDYDYCLRAKKAGFTIAVSDDATVYHPDNQSKTMRRHRRLEKLLGYFPAILGIVKHDDSRSLYTVKNFITLSKRYQPKLIFFVQFLLSLLVLSILAFFNKKIAFSKTLQTYFRTICAE